MSAEKRCPYRDEHGHQCVNVEALCEPLPSADRNTTHRVSTYECQEGASEWSPPLVLSCPGNGTPAGVHVWFHPAATTRTDSTTLLRDARDLMIRGLNSLIDGDTLSPSEEYLARQLTRRWEGDEP